MVKTLANSEIVEMVIARLAKVGLVDYKDGTPRLADFPFSAYSFVETFLNAVSGDAELREAIRERWFKDE